MHQFNNQSTRQEDLAKYLASQADFDKVTTNFVFNSVQQFMLYTA